MSFWSWLLWERDPLYKLMKFGGESSRRRQLEAHDQQEERAREAFGPAQTPGAGPSPVRADAGLREGGSRPRGRAPGTSRSAASPPAPELRTAGLPIKGPETSWPPLRVRCARPPTFRLTP
jgi:hypothetical protein